MDAITHMPVAVASPPLKTIYGSAPHLSHELPSLTLYGPLLRTHQGGHYHLGNTDDKKEGSRGPAPEHLAKWIPTT